MSFIHKGVLKLQSLYFQGRLRVNSKLGLPAQTAQEIRIFKTIFDNSISERKIKIFEWGSGFSTIYYSDYLRNKGVQFEWHTMDNNKSWHEKTKSEIYKRGIQPYVHMYLKEFQPFWEKPGWGDVPPACGIFGPKSENEQAYVNYPRLLKERFDIVIVDARFRRHCIQTAKDVLLPKGIVIMHDAQKPHYHVGLEEFTYTRFLEGGSWYPFQKAPNKIWIGSMDNAAIFESLEKS